MSQDYTPPNQSGSGSFSAPTSSGSLDTSHKTLVSLAVIFAVLMGLVEIGSTNHSASLVVTMLLFGALLLLLINDAGPFQNLANNYPWIP